ncbi:MAG: hypothetical protein OK456_10505 [Thaumarchaeota archaeon]|nr:hypothetical protein [Nitrososphaerota archaeon]
MSPLQRRGVQATIAVLVIVAVVGVVVFHPASSGTGTVTSLSSGTPCSSPTPVDPVPSLANESVINTMHNLANGSIRSLAFIMQPGATATLCIHYDANQTFTAQGLNADAVTVNASSPANGSKPSVSVAPGVSFKLDSFSTGSSGGNVMYTITTADASEGFYSLSYPGQCELVPFAVAIGNSPLSSFEFPGFFTAPNCPLQAPFTGYTNITGFSGMTTVWLTG